MRNEHACGGCARWARSTPPQPRNGPETIERRLSNAPAEMAQYRHYEYLVVNDDLEQATSRLLAIVDAERARVRRLRALGSIHAPTAAERTRDDRASAQQRAGRDGAVPALRVPGGERRSRAGHVEAAGDRRCGTSTRAAAARAGLDPRPHSRGTDPRRSSVGSATRRPRWRSTGITSTWW